MQHHATPGRAANVGDDWHSPRFDAVRQSLKKTVVANGQTPSRPVTQDDALLAMRDLRDKISTPTRDLFESGAVPAAADTTAGTHTRAVAYRMTAEERVSAQDEAILEVLRDVLAMLKSTRNPQVEYLARVMKKWGRENGLNL